MSRLRVCQLAPRGWSLHYGGWNEGLESLQALFFPVKHPGRCFWGLRGIWDRGRFRELLRCFFVVRFFFSYNYNTGYFHLMLRYENYEFLLTQKGCFVSKRSNKAQFNPARIEEPKYWSVNTGKEKPCSSDFFFFFFSTCTKKSFAASEIWGENRLARVSKADYSQHRRRDYFKEQLKLRPELKRNELGHGDTTSRYRTSFNHVSRLQI